MDSHLHIHLPNEMTAGEVKEVLREQSAVSIEQDVEPYREALAGIVRLRAGRDPLDDTRVQLEEWWRGHPTLLRPREWADAIIALLLVEPPDEIDTDGEER